jgi:hypothetical protein
MGTRIGVDDPARTTHFRGAFQPESSTLTLRPPDEDFMMNLAVSTLRLPTRRHPVRLSLQRLETRATPAVIGWDGGAGVPNWNDAANHPATLHSHGQADNPSLGSGSRAVTSHLIAPAPQVSAVSVNNGAAQRSRVTTMSVSFDQSVTLPTAPESAFRLNSQSDTREVGLVAAVDSSGPGKVVTLTFNGGAVDGTSLADGRYTLTVFASQVSMGGDQLDGDGDGNGGDDYVLVGDTSTAPKLFRLFGDGDGDGDVDAIDFGAFRAALASTTDLSFDGDGDGDVDSADQRQFRLQWETSV